MELDKKLVALRKKNGMSQAEVSAELGVSRQAISKWEVGDTVPSTGNLKHLSELYGVSLEYLFDAEENNAPEGRTDKKDSPAKDIAKGNGKDFGQYWKNLAIIMSILCGILSAILFYIKVSEKSEDSILAQESEIKEEDINGNLGSGFDLEW